MQLRTRSSFWNVTSCLLVFASAAVCAHAQDEDTHSRGRKYKAPPDTANIEVTVVKGFNKKPIDGAHVIFHPEKDGKDEGYMEVKTHEDGKATIDVIPVGAHVRVQVLAEGFSTYAQDYSISSPQQAITIEMERPKAQVSTYVDNSGKAADLKPGIQEPIRPKKNASTGKSGNTPSSTPSTAPSSARSN